MPTDATDRAASPSTAGGTRPPPAFQVSVKGVVVRAGRVLLLHNERDEWELPGGRLECDETPEQCVVREIGEETGWSVRTTAILDSWLYRISSAGRDVFIVTYGCELLDGFGDVVPVVSHEHKEIGLFSPEEVRGLRMPDGYRRSITAWLDRPATPAAGRRG